MCADDETTEGFRGEYDFLSNMFPFEVHYKGLSFPSSEHLYQWLKVDPEAPNGPEWQEKIRTANHGKLAKTLIRYKKCPIVKVEDWDAFRIESMRIALWAKFRQPEMARRLLATGDMALVEHNQWKDTFFGVYHGSGQNHLGQLLMKCRMYLRSLENAPHV